MKINKNKIALEALLLITASKLEKLLTFPILALSFLILYSQSNGNIIPSYYLGIAGVLVLRLALKEYTEMMTPILEQYVKLLLEQKAIEEKEAEHKNNTANQK